VAASEAVAQLSERTTHASAEYGEGGEELEPAGAPDSSGLLSFSRFDLALVLAHAQPLLSSGGAEFDAPQGAGSRAERLVAARAALRRRLGLEGPMADEMELNELVNDDDLDVAAPAPGAVSGRAAADVMGEAGAPAASSRPLSVREQNQAKRRAKAAALVGSTPGETIFTRNATEAINLVPRFTP
jgi:hypothetical protein